MKKESLSSIQKNKIEGVCKTTFMKGGVKYLVRVRRKETSNIITVASFKKEGEAIEHYNNIKEGKIIINCLFNTKKDV